MNFAKKDEVNMNCKYCGCLIEDGDESKYCPECGKDLVEGASEGMDEIDSMSVENSEEIIDDFDDAQDVYERTTEDDETYGSEDMDSSLIDSDLTLMDMDNEESLESNVEDKPVKAGKGTGIIVAFAAILLVGCIVVALAVSSMQKKKQNSNMASTNSDSTQSAGSGDSDSELSGGDATENVVVGDYSEYSQYVTSLGTYVGIEVNMTPTEVTDEEVVNTVNSNVMKGTTTEEITDRNIVQDGDIANIDYTGYMDGEAFAGGSDTGFDLTIGSGSFIDGFEDGLIGATVGETVEINVTFPEGYPQADYAGKEATFKVTVNAIKQQVTPELNDEWVANNSDYSNVEEYQESIRTQLEEAAAQEVMDTKPDRVLEQIYNNSTIEKYPEGRVENFVAYLNSTYESYASMFGTTLENFVTSNFGMTMEEYTEQLTSIAQINVGTEMICYRIAEEEGITLTDEEYQAGAQQYATENGYESVEEFEAAYTKAQIYDRILIERVMEYVASNAVEVTE